MDNAWKYAWYCMSISIYFHRIHFLLSFIRLVQSCASTSELKDYNNIPSPFLIKSRQTSRSFKVSARCSCMFLETLNWSVEISILSTANWDKERRKAAKPRFVHTTVITENETFHPYLVGSVRVLPSWMKCREFSNISRALWIAHLFRLM